MLFIESERRSKDTLLLILSPCYPTFMALITYSARNFALFPVFTVCIISIEVPVPFSVLLFIGLPQRFIGDNVFLSSLHRYIMLFFILSVVFLSVFQINRRLICFSLKPLQFHFFSFFHNHRRRRKKDYFLPFFTIFFLLKIKV